MSDDTPVLAAIREHWDRDTHSFALPGHRQILPDTTTGHVLGDAVYAADVAALRGPIAEAEARMADAVGADHTLFSTCGSTMNVHAALLTIAGPGRKVLVARNVHKSVIGGLILSGAVPIYLPPSFDPDRPGMAHPPAASTVAASLYAHPGVAAVIVITPTEYGTGADIEGIAEACRANRVPLLVDEAWGAHFGWHRHLPPSAISAGANLVVQSGHKAGTALLQSSMLHVRAGGLIDVDTLKQRLDVLNTTSVSGLLAGSLDAWRRLMLERGTALLDEALRNAEKLRGHLHDYGYDVLDERVNAARGVAEFDPLKITVAVNHLGLTGYQVRDWLEQRYALQVQLGDTTRVVCSLTAADSPMQVARLAAAFADLATKTPDPDRAAPEIPTPQELTLRNVLTPREAFFSDTKQVPWQRAAGNIAAEMISPYPPGVPVICPGERINGAVVDYLRAGLAAGMKIPDATDPTLDTFRVVR